MAGQLSRNLTERGGVRSPSCTGGSSERGVVSATRPTAQKRTDGAARTGRRDVETGRGHTHPRRHCVVSLNVRQLMSSTRRECTASISTHTTGDPGGSGSTTRMTRKCFSRSRGSTAVHFVCSSFFGLKVCDTVSAIEGPRDAAA